jgi:hypothetical protein
MNGGVQGPGGVAAAFNIRRTLLRDIRGARHLCLRRAGDIRVIGSEVYVLRKRRRDPRAPLPGIAFDVGQANARSYGMKMFDGKLRRLRDSVRERMEALGVR